MKSYLKHYKIKLKTLAPVFVGSGKEINKNEYIFDSDKIYVSDERKLMDIIIKKNLMTRFIESMNMKSFNLKMWLDENGISDYKSLSAYTLLGVENIDDKHSLKGIQACIKNAYNEPYIPGSSLKGALRTVILWNEVYNNIANLEDIKHELMANVRMKSGKEIKKICAAANTGLEKRFFNKKIDEVDMSIMRGLIVGDSKPASLDDIVLCEKIDVSADGTKKKPNILRECIRPNTEIEFDLTVDSGIFNYDATDIDDMLKNYAADYFTTITSMFPNGNDDENAIFIGGGSGYFSKTVAYSLFDKDDAVDFVKNYLAKTTPREHMHIKDREISPHMQKCTRCDGKIYEMGKCRIEIEELCVEK